LFKHFGSWSVLKTLQLRRGLRYLGGGLLGSPVVAGQLVQTSFKAEFKAAPLRIGVENSLAERIKTDMTCLSLPALLRYEDKNSMAFAREARVPFLDYRLVEFVAGLPLNLKLHQGWTKYCLRRGAQDLLPAKILRRKDKLGFATPEDHWLRQELRDEVRRTLMGATFLPQFITMPQLLRHFDAFVARQRPLLSSEFFLRFFIVEKWAHRFLMS
jgi:asparagine synthase (glutamine-hydrolysing)